VIVSTRISRYRFSRLVEDADGRQHLTESEPYWYRPLADNLVHVVQEGDDLCTVAGRYYGAAVLGGETLWWVVAQFQPEPILDPTLALVPGSTLIVPSVRTVLEDVLSETRRAAGVRA
jgi:hypothetical protein